MKRIFVISLILLFSFFHSFSQPKNIIGKEEIKLEIKRDLDLPEVVNRYQQRIAINQSEDNRGAISSLIGVSASLATQAIVSMIEKSQKQRSSEWSSPITRDYFYASPSFFGPMDPTGMQFQGFKLSRTATSRETGETSKNFYLECSIDESKIEDFLLNSRFSLKLDTLYIDMSSIKAKYTKSKRAQVNIEISIMSTWMDQNLSLHKNEILGVFNISLGNIKYDKESPIVSFGKGNEDMITGACFFVPRSYGAYLNGGEYKPCWGKGEFDVKVSIKEVTKNKPTGKTAIEYVSKGLPEIIKSISTNKVIVGAEASTIIQTY